MKKKMGFVLLAVAVVLGAMVGVASAAQNVANTNQKGSLLVWPKIAVGGEDSASTYVTIGNDYYTEVWVKCYWVDADQNVEDFMFRLTPNQPVWFDAESGQGTVSVPPFDFPSGVGELKCWAVNAAGTEQIAFNHLYGSALIMHEGTAFQYNAWSFTARGVTQGNPVGTAGQILLTGQAGGYDACPQYLVENFMAAYELEAEQPGMEREPIVTLVPCRQDLRQDRTPTCTKLKFDVWNENETKYTGAFRCIKCWAEGELAEIGNYKTGYGYGFGSDKFTFEGLHTFMARFRVTGVKSPVCDGKITECTGVTQVASPLLGVLWHEIEIVSPQSATEFVFGTTPHTAGADPNGFVYWDPQGGTPEAPGR